MEPTWEQSRTRRLGYIRRRPEESLLYRVIYHYRDEFERSWQERFEHHYGALRHEVLTAFDRYLSCGIVAHGCARARCEKCGHSILIAYSCKRRGLCPSCDTKRAILFAEHLNESVLLPIPYRHVVWSLPKRLRVYFRFDRKLIGKLYQAAWRAWEDSVSTSGKTGAIMAVHSSGDLLHFHPHIHSLCLDGAVDAAQRFIPNTAIDTPLLQEYFAERVCTALLETGLIEQDTVDQIRSQEHSGFNVWCGEPISPEDADQRRFIARYLKRAPLALDRMSLIENGAEPIIRIVKHIDDAEVHRDLSPLDCLAELQQAIPNTWEQTTRYYGLHASRTRGVEPAGFRAQLSANTEVVWLDDDSGKTTLPAQPTETGALPDPAEPTTKPSQTWAACIKLIYEVDPLECPRCHSPMKIIAFLQQPSEIQKIADNLGYPKYRAPPPFKKPLSSPEQIVIPLFDDILFAA